jgi:hypothetical protein
MECLLIPRPVPYVETPHIVLAPEEIQHQARPPMIGDGGSPRASGTKRPAVGDLQSADRGRIKTATRSSQDEKREGSATEQSAERRQIDPSQTAAAPSIFGADPISDESETPQAATALGEYETGCETMNSLEHGCIR